MIAGGSDNGGGRKFRPPPFPKQAAPASENGAAAVAPADLQRADRPETAPAETRRPPARPAARPPVRVAATAPIAVAADLFDRPPPQDLFAERALLGSILIDPDRWDDVALLVRSSDFYNPVNARIFEAMRLVADDGKQPDIVLLRSRLKKLGILQEIGADYLADVLDCVPTSHNAEHYAELIAQAASARALIDAGCEMIRAGHDPAAEPRQRIAAAESRLFEIFEGRRGAGPRAMADVLMAAMVEIDRRYEAKSLLGLKTGFAPLDSATGGLRPGELTILAARPAAGKSALAAQIAEHVALDQGRRVLYVSLEMKDQELVDRMLCCRARVNSRDSKNGTISEEERRRICEASNALSQAKISFDFSYERNMSEIASMARREKRRQDLALVVVDYLQLIEPENPRDIREQQVALISKRLKRLAGEVDVPVLCLCQLNRDAEKNDEPQLRHLRESGAIEQDADNVWMLHQLDLDRTKDENQAADLRAKLFLRKQRGGERTEVLLFWRPVWTLFEPADMQMEF